MSDEPSLTEHFRRALLSYLQRSGVDTATLAEQMAESVPGMVVVPVAALEDFLAGRAEPSDAFINICSRFVARVATKEE